MVQVTESALHACVTRVCGAWEGIKQVFTGIGWLHLPMLLHQMLANKSVFCSVLAAG